MSWYLPTEILLILIWYVNVIIQTCTEIYFNMLLYGDMVPYFLPI